MLYKICASIVLEDMEPDLGKEEVLKYSLNHI